MSLSVVPPNTSELLSSNLITTTASSTTSKKRGKLINCSAKQCTTSFRPSNLYLVKIQIGNTSYSFCGIEHFNSGGIETNDVFNLLLTSEIQLKNKEEFTNLPKTFKCGAGDLSSLNCTTSCSTFVNVSVGTTFKNFCCCSCLWKYLGLLSVKRWEQLIQKNK